MAQNYKISLAQARNFFLQKQLLVDRAQYKGKTGALAIIEQLGYIQIDTINVIERSHHIVIFSRCPDYERSYLHDLQAKDKKIFEYLAHAASFIPITDYRFYLRAIEKKPKADSWLGKWIRKNQKTIAQVKKHIIEQGPLMASDFGDIENRKRGTWWDWKPAKMALEVLFWQGFLMIKERRKFQRVYDLTERVLPKGLNLTKPSEEEEKNFFIKRALNTLGVATVKDINSYIGISGKLNDAVEKMVRKKEILEINVGGLTKPYYILSTDLANMTNEKIKPDPSVRFLSPFDNAIILRDRTKALFDFDYALESYVPSKNRKYGYFCLPILWLGKLVGLIDLKADRKEKKLIINNLHLLDKSVNLRHFYPAFTKTLNDFKNFHASETIDFNQRVPKKLVNSISEFLNSK